MPYGSVRQYRHRMARMIARGEEFPMSVCCRSCADQEEICDACYPAEDRWGKLIDTLSNTEGVIERIPVRELVR